MMIHLEDLRDGCGRLAEVSPSFPEYTAGPESNAILDRLMEKLEV